MRTIQLSALVNRKWEPQGDPLPMVEFFEVNEDMDPTDKLRVLALGPGDSIILNEGCHGTFKIERLQKGA